MGSGLAVAASGMLASQHYGGLTHLFRRIKNALRSGRVLCAAQRPALPARGARRVTRLARVVGLLLL